MIKIDSSVLAKKTYCNKEKNAMQSMIDRHVDWFIKTVSEADCPEDWGAQYKGKKYKDYLEDVLGFDKTMDFKEQIRPYIVSDNLKDLRKKNIGLNGVDGRTKEEKLSEEQKAKRKNAKHLFKAFCYEKFCDSHATEEKWDAYKFCKGLNVSVCPYCNRQYIFTVAEHEEHQREGNVTCYARPELDHFYPKDIYPYLSCNLYNLIPSCSVCNHAKSDTDFGEMEESKLIYPYGEEFGDDGVFRVKIDDVYIETEKLFKGMYTDDKQKEQLQICIESSGSKKYKIDKSKEVFHLEPIYNMHKLDLVEFLKKYRNYCDPKRTELLKIFKSVQPAVHIDESQLKIFFDIMSSQLETQILGMYDTLEQYPLKKMKTDIKKQLDGNR